MSDARPQVVAALPAINLGSRDPVVDAPRPQLVRIGGPLTRLFTLRVKSWRRFQTAEPPVVIEGDCLRPWLMPGDVIWYQDSPPKDGDLCVAAMIYRRASSGAIGAAEYEIVRRAVKQYRIVDGQAMLCSADGAVRASSHEVLGAVCAWYRPRFWRRPSMRSMRFDVGG